MNPLLSCRELQLKRSQRTIIQSLSWSISSGEIWGVLGANGIGKSTLLLALAGLYPISRGHIWVEQKKISALSAVSRAKKIGLVLQTDEPMAELTVFEAILMGRYPYRTSEPQCIREEKAQAIMHQFGLNPLAASPLTALSGGEQKRTFLATVLAQSPTLYCLDEPLNHLDMAYQQQVMQSFIREAQAHAKAVVCVLHDINTALRYCSHLLLFKNANELVAGRVEQVATQEHLESLYRCPLEQRSQWVAI